MNLRTNKEERPPPTSEELSNMAAVAARLSRELALTAEHQRAKLKPGWSEEVSRRCAEIARQAREKRARALAAVAASRSASDPQG